MAARKRIMIAIFHPCIFRLVSLLLLILAACAACGCSTYNYEYVLYVQSEGRHMANDPSWISYVGFDPAVVTIDCDGKTKHFKFDSFGETKTIRFSESYRIMIDGGGIPRGFSVHINRTGYKPWSATYDGWLTGDVMKKNLDTFIRLDSILLEPEGSPNNSIRVSGGPVNFVDRSHAPSTSTQKSLPSREVN